MIAGRWLNKKMSDKLFYRIGHLALVLLGIRLILDVSELKVELSQQSCRLQIKGIDV